MKRERQSKMFFKNLLVMFSVAMVGTALTPSSFLNTVDKDRLRSVFKASLAQDDLPSVAYSILGYNLLGETAPDAAGLCKKLQAGVDQKDVQLAAVYQATVAAKALGGCTLKLSSAVTQVIKHKN